MNYLIFILAAQGNIGSLNNITGCYGVNTLIEYRRNLNQIVIFLETMNNPNCTNFPPGVDVNLTFSEASTSGVGLVPYSYTIKKFNYSTTTQLVINDVPDISGLSLQFILVEIYSYAEITQIQVYEVNEIVSSLTECFYPNSTITISYTHLQIELIATGLCKIQINQMTKISLVMTDSILEFDVVDYADLATLKTNYDQDLPFSVALAGDYTSLWNIQSIAVRVYIASSTSAIKFSFASIYYESVANLFSTASVMPIDYSFYVMLIPNLAVFTPFMAAAQAKGYNSLIIRLNYIEIGFTIQNRYADYDLSKQIIQFSCDQNDITFNTQCMNYYHLVKNEDSNVTNAFLELLFYQDNTVVTVHKTVLNTSVTIAEKVILKIDENGFNFMFYYHEIDFINVTSFQITATTHNQEIANLNPQIQFTQSWDRNTPALVYNCSDTNQTCVDMAKQYLLPNTVITIEYQYDDGVRKHVETVPVTLVYRTNYKSTSAVSITIGVLCCVSSVVFTVYQSIKVRRQIQSLKKKK
ncbi:Conserved_hypothetical protein [Hexamita inflata]|uniref:Uncharacterized protein n=1 Tax=Hexamita inflata TaxID=28002 RepID=A0AA86RRG7_9EUKA|nr:Conserved hypothetical protein [Hexamita inflata]